MIVAGCDIGSLTAKAVLLKDGILAASSIIRVKSNAVESARVVMQQCLDSQGITFEDIDRCCSTGYGRLTIPFANTNFSEISCHGMGAFRTDPSIRTIIDIGGQDCKVISVNGSGRVVNFIMNDKCAAGTGRSLEILAKTIGVPLESLGPLTIQSRKPLEITNKCSIFMELEVIDALYRGKKKKDIASGLSDAVARRVAALAESVDIRDGVCITGGVSKNRGVVKHLERRLGVHFRKLSTDPQLMGALGAAVLAMDQPLPRLERKTDYDNCRC
jgi:(R)-2-hydroxyacyl-CoA dehydratese activating ATPase